MTTSVACVLKRFTENRLFRRYFAVNVFGLDVIHEHDQQILQTPLAWRKRPDGFSHYNDMQYMRMMDYRLIKCIPMDEFMRGANASFRCVVNSIFSHPKLLPHRITSPEEIRKQIKIEDEDIREEALAFPDIFETFLSRFLEQSVMRFLHDCPNHKFAYELMQIRSVKIYAAEQFLFSVELAKKHPYLIFDQSMKEQFQEVKILTAPTKLPGDEDCHNIQEVFRVWVDVECDDTTTEQVVQGDKMPSTVKHQILLEASLESDMWNKGHFYHNNWKIVDIDNWLDGNKEVWLRKRLV